MEEKRVTELRKFVVTITDKNIAAFIDRKKLCLSGIFNLSVQMATEHAAKHGDFSYLNNLLALLEGTKHACDLIYTVRPKLNFVLTETKPRRFKKATPEQIAKAATQYISKPVAVKRAPTKPAQKKVKYKATKASHDLMDPHLMLPGSYGNGKHR